MESAKMEKEEPEYPEVYKVIGAPGTGKTTRVVGNPDLDLDGLFIENMPEYSLEEQMLVTYTNAGVDEAAERLNKMLPDPMSTIETRVTTIHSRCYHALNLNKDQVVSHWDKKNWAEMHDLEYGWDDDSDDIMGDDQQPGNVLMDMYGWLQSNRVPLEDWQECPNSEWDHPGDPETLMKDWERWKQKNNKVGFGDMIERVIDKGRDHIERLGWVPIFSAEDMSHKEVFKHARHHKNRDPDRLRSLDAFVDTKVLYVDEVQDLTPLQWEWYLMNKLVAEKVYIGGDDDQTIYGWSGADPNFMLNEEGDFEVLDRTYRIPQEVWDVADGVINQVDTRQEKDVTPDGDGGEFVTYRNPSARQLVEHMDDPERDVFVLFRARYQIDEFRDDLHRLGIPYRNMSTFDTWSDDIVSIKDGLWKIKKARDTGENYSLRGDEVQALIDYAGDRMVSKNSFSQRDKAMANLSGLDAMSAMDLFDFRGGFTWKRYLELAQNNGDLNYYEKEAIDGVIRKGNVDMNPDRVRIGTIHSSKGKEADTVILGLDSTRTIKENMVEELVGEDKHITDDERRVYYVGMTRASEKLVLAEGVMDESPSLSLRHLLDEEHYKEATGQQTIGASQTW